MPKLEVLARELTIVGEAKHQDFSELIKECRDEYCSREKLYHDLIKNKLKYFAIKLMSNYYDEMQEKENNGKTNT